ncbi:MAG: hypothetical protein ABJF05_05345 [Paracoccaceae bacterium]
MFDIFHLYFLLSVKSQIVIVVVIALNLAIVWVWYVVLTGKRVATIGKRTVLFLSSYWVLEVIALGPLTADESKFLTMFFWPFLLIDSVALIVYARLYIFAALTVLITLATLSLSDRMTGRSLILSLLIGSILTVSIPAFIQNALVKNEMSKTAVTAGLTIRITRPLHHSVKEPFSVYRDPHGVACDSEGWPFLWSYHHRNWNAVHPESGFGGHTPEKIMNTLCYVRP